MGTVTHQLPMQLPFMTEREDGIGNGAHPPRYDMSGKKTVLISTCGFYTAEGNYDGVYSLFDHMCGKEQYTAIFCGQGELFRVPERIVVPLAYLAFGVMWTVSCFVKIPLTAHYSMNAYDGEKALENPLFMKTNRILTLMWGILYLLTPIWTYAMMGTGIGYLTGAVNSILPFMLGIFTRWFQKWYPAKVARG